MKASAMRQCKSSVPIETGKLCTFAHTVFLIGALRRCGTCRLGLARFGPHRHAQKPQQIRKIQG